MKETWWLAEGARAEIERRGGLQVAAWMRVGAPDTLLSSDRQSAAVRVAGDPPLLAKWRAPIRGRRRRTFLRASRERREALAMLEATRRGIPCPAPWAVGERRAGGVLRGSVYLRPFDDGARTAEDAVREDAARLGGIALALRGWHDLGFRHGDCYLKNILVDGAGDAPRPIGCPAARWLGTGPRLDDARLKDLAQFVVGIPPTMEPERGADALRAYADADGLPTAEALFLRIRPFVDRIMAKKAARLATRPVREPDGPPVPVPLDPHMAPVTRVRVRALITP